jgi:hypothetical protein
MISCYHIGGFGILFLSPLGLHHKFLKVLQLTKEVSERVFCELFDSGHFNHFLQSSYNRVVSGVYFLKLASEVVNKLFNLLL